MSDRKFQQIDRVLKLLPYSDKLDAYGDVAWQSIKATFAQLIGSNQILTGETLFRSLSGYVHFFGHRFTKAEHVAIIKFCLNSAFCHQVDQDVADGALCTIYKMLEGFHYGLTPEDLTLNWKDFQQATINIPASMDVRYCSESFNRRPQLPKVLRLCKQFFPITCVEEIWKEYRSFYYHTATYGPHDHIFQTLASYTPIVPRTFDEISRVWLNDIFHLWYKDTNAQSLTHEIINLLGTVADNCPGRIDWEPHMDRLFNCLMSDLFVDTAKCTPDLSKTNMRAIRGYANLIVAALVQNSTVIARLSSVLKVCNVMYHPSCDNDSMLFYVTLCQQLSLRLAQRLRFELFKCPEVVAIHGDDPPSSRLTSTQVDEFVDILLPCVLDASLYTRRSRCTQPVLATLRYLGLLRPRLLLPRVLEALESGFDLPELPMRVTRPLMALSETCQVTTSIRLVISWNASTMGQQPGDQADSPPIDGQVLMQTPEDREFLKSHIAACSFPDGRTQVTRILRCCLAVMNFNDPQRLQLSIATLGHLFLTTPMKDYTDVCLPNLSETEGSFQALAEFICPPNQPQFASSRIALATLETEELTLQIYTRLLVCIGNINESAHLRIASNEVAQTEHVLAPKARDSLLLCGLTGLGVSIGIAASPVPRLRVRLVKIFIDAMFSNQWTRTISRQLNYQLLWLINGKRNIKSQLDENGLDIADVALYGLNLFWPRFLRLFYELDKENGLSCRGRTEPRFLSLLGVLPAFISAILPSHLSDQRIVSDFVRPLIELLSRLLTISLGSGGSSEPSHELSVSAGTCAGVLLHRLIAYSINLDHVDLLNAETFVNHPAWTPFVTWRDMLPADRFWNVPNPESFSLAEYAVKSLLLPCLDALKAATAELQGHVSSEGLPGVVAMSGLTSSSQQREFLISLVTWISMMRVGLMEGLKPRRVIPADVETVHRFCPELELAADTAVKLLCPTAISTDFEELPIRLFEMEVNGQGLRDRIFCTGLAFLEVLTDLSEKYDHQVLDTSSESKGESIVTHLLSEKCLKTLIMLIYQAGLNENSDEGGPFHVLVNTDLKHLLRNNLGAISCTSLPASPSDNLIPFLTKITGTTSRLLEAYAAGIAPSPKLDAFVPGVLPLAWLAVAQERHNLFVSGFLRRQGGSVYPGHEHLSLVSIPRIPVCGDLLRMTEITARLGQVSNCDGITRLVVICLNIWVSQYIPGAVSLVTRNVLKMLKESATSSFMNDKELLYRAGKQQRCKAFLTLGYWIKLRQFNKQLYEIDPLLWAEVWVTLAKVSLFEPIEEQQTHHQLTMATITQRYADQETICQSINTLFETFEKFSHRLYFPSNANPEAYPDNSELRRLLVSGRQLADLFVPGQIFQPNFPLARCMALRRESYTHFAHGLYSECLAQCDGERLDMRSNSAFIACMLSNWLLPTEAPLNALWQSGCQLVAPPPPPLPADMIRFALRLITSQQTSLATAAIGFLTRVIAVYYLRSRPYETVWCDPAKVAVQRCSAFMDVENPSRMPGLMQTGEGEFLFDPEDAFLSSDEAYTAHHHFPDITRSLVFFPPGCQIRSPFSKHEYPQLKEEDGGLCLKQLEWLKPRAEMDFTCFSPLEQTELQNGLEELASFFGSRQSHTEFFWATLSERFLRLHRYANAQLNANILNLISQLVEMLGPRSIVFYLERYVNSLMYPLVQPDGVTEFIGPNLAIDVVTAMSVGSAWWSRLPKLTLHAFTIPRLLMSIEVASLYASNLPTTQSLDDRLHEALTNVRWWTTAIAIGNGGTTLEQPHEDVIASGAGITEGTTFAIDQRMFTLLAAIGDRKKRDGSTSAPSSPIPTSCSPAFQPGGPKLRLVFGYEHYINTIISLPFCQSDCLAYLFQFVRQVLRDCELERSSETTAFEPLSGTGELMDAETIKPSCCTHDLYSVPGMEAFGGGCPVCLAALTLPLPQREFLFYKISLALVQALRGLSIKLLNGIFKASHDRIWERLTCSPAVWNREVGGLFSLLQSSAVYDQVLSQQVPCVFVYSIDRNQRHQLPLFPQPSPERLKSLPVISELKANCHVGQDFAFKRFFPLLVRDSIVILLLKGVQPSVKTFALQNSLLEQAAEKLTPATSDLMHCSPSVKWTALVQLKSRISSLFLCMMPVIKNIFPSIPASPEIHSRMSVFLFLAPIIADLVSTSNLFWTGGRSEMNKSEDPEDMDICIGRTINSFGRLVCTGATDIRASREQSNILLDVISVFIGHVSWKTRVFGLLSIRVMPLCNITSFWGDHSKELGGRLRQMLTTCLADPWIEVARGACKGLSYLLQYGILNYDDAWFEQLVRQSRHPLYRRQPTPDSLHTVVVVNTEEGQVALRTRHAGILGLCSFVHANVHETPDYLPAIIAELADHANDPQPISKSVADTLQAYSRSHHDRWGAEHRVKFTEAQLDAYLSVVSSVSYYV